MHTLVMVYGGWSLHAYLNTHAYSSSLPIASGTMSWNSPD